MRLRLRRRACVVASTHRTVALCATLGLFTMAPMKNPQPRLTIINDGAAAITAHSSASAKVRLFRKRFRGRDNIYPKLWINKTKGNKGYAPACSNEWLRGVCDKPRVRCGSCPEQAFIPVTETVLRDHLQGHHVIGVYPLLEDDTCWLLAIDFDKASWKADVTAFRVTCRRLGVPVLIERSRSGEGAHVWFFFTSPVSARSARSLGSYLLTATMAEHHALDMRSYDRMFPNQDAMPRGGFGNLIALPLQHEARAQGNTLFVDDALSPMDDQWAALAQYAAIEPRRVEELTRAATTTGDVLGLPAPEEDEDSKPWERLPSGRRQVRIVGEIPKSIRAVLRQMVFIEKRGLPSSLLNALKRLAAFQNPEFYKRQQLRLSVARTPRVIACAEDHLEHVALPRGCLDAANALLGELDSDLVVNDEREQGLPITAEFHGELSEVQQSAANALLNHDTGILVAPPGIGKTVIGAYVTASRATNTLILVHRSQLLEQWINQLSVFLGIPTDAVGRIGGGKRNLTGRLDVATFQSLVKHDKVDDAVADYGHVIVDECHHVSSASFERVLRAVRARYVMGLTATPKRRDGRHPIIEMQLGAIRFALKDKHVTKAQPFAHQVITRRTGTPPTEATTIQAIYGHLGSSEERNSLIVRDVAAALEAGRSPLVLTERRDHLDLLHSRLREHSANVIVLHGGLAKRKRANAIGKLRALGDHEERVVLATGRFAGEGFDDPQLDMLFLALPIAWRGTLLQYAGRLHRHHHAKRDVQIIDYVDSNIPVLARMFEKRRRGYKSMGYTFREHAELHGAPTQLSLRPRSLNLAPPPPRTSTLLPNDSVSPASVPVSELDAMIDDVLVCAFTKPDQAVAFLEMLGDQLELPFRATVGKTPVSVEALSVNEHAQVIAHCSTGAARKRHVLFTRLIPSAAPIGWEWAEAHNRWAASV